MTQNSVVRARIDERTKRQAAAALKKIGLSVSDAFRLLMVRVAAEKTLPFEPLNPTSVRLEVEQNHLVRKWGGFFLGVFHVEGPQDGRFLEKGDAENL